MSAFIDFANSMSERWADGMWLIVWQSAIFGVLVALVALALRRARAAARVWLWMLVPLKLLIVPLLIISLLLYAAPWSSAMYLIVPRLIQGMSVSCFWTASENFITGELPRDRLGQGMAFYMLSGMVTAAFAPSLAEWIAYTYGYRSLFVIMAAVVLLVIWIASLVQEQPEPSRRAAPAHEIRTLLAQPMLWTTLALSLFYGASRIAYEAFLPVYGLTQGLTKVGTFYLFF